MALSFANAQGSAIKTTVDTYKFKDGENTVRLIGGVLPRYVYWLPNGKGTTIPVECLSFSRELEKYTNNERDYVPQYFPEEKSKWNYVINCIDPTDGAVKALYLKKKLYEQIKEAATDLGDPTDINTGWDVVFKKVKTGPQTWNIEYNLSVLKCKVRALSDAEKKAVAEAQSIDEKFPRQTPEEVKQTLERLIEGKANSAEKQENEARELEETINELN